MSPLGTPEIITYDSNPVAPPNDSGPLLAAALALQASQIAELRDEIATLRERDSKMRATVRELTLEKRALADRLTAEQIAAATKAAEPVPDVTALKAVNDLMWKRLHALGDTAALERFTRAYREAMGI